jgi:alkylation response protein AidB-like acyl-CoA dehydrogenase
MSESEREQEFRVEVRQILDQELPSAWRGVGALSGEDYRRFVASWRVVLQKHGWLAPTWPIEWGGGGRSALEETALLEELTLAGVPAGGPNDTNGIRLLGNTLLRCGTQAQRDYFLPKILSGEHRWCQGFSEPDAGSDLASIRTSAKLVDGKWIVDGQKVWTTAAHLANWIFVLARTNPDARKHRGLSFLLVPMTQAGVEVRPLRQISGGSEFNEVFFTGAEADESNVVGEVNGGWAVAMTMLGFERGANASALPIRLQFEFDRLLELIREQGRTHDPLVRQRLGWFYGRIAMMKEIGVAVRGRLIAGEEVGDEVAIIKVVWSEYHRELTRWALNLLGPEALSVIGRPASSVDDTDDPGASNSSASWVSVYLNSQAGTIYAGTSNIQRNIIAERLLGLPREPMAVS